MHVAVRPRDHVASGAQDAAQTISARVVFAYGGDRRVKNEAYGIVRKLENPLWHTDENTLSN